MIILIAASALGALLYHRHAVKRRAALNNLKRK